MIFLFLLISHTLTIFDQRSENQLDKKYNKIEFHNSYHLEYSSIEVYLPSVQKKLTMILFCISEKPPKISLIFWQNLSFVILHFFVQLATIV